MTGNSVIRSGFERPHRDLLHSSFTYPRDIGQMHFYISYGHYSMSNMLTCAYICMSSHYNEHDSLQIKMREYFMAHLL